MRMVRCYECGKQYDYDDDGFCPKCGAFNQPLRNGSTAGERNVSLRGEEAAASGKGRSQIQRELGENLKQMEKAVSRLLSEQNRGRWLPGGDR